MSRSLILALIGAALAVYAQAQSPLEDAVTLTRQKRYAEARKTLDGVPEPAGDKQRIAFHRLRAAIASGLNEPVFAADEMEKAFELAPDDRGLAMAAAVAELEAGRLDAAMERARKAGDTAAGQELIGEIAEKRGEYVEAAKAYQAAVVLEPAREEYRIALALEFAQHYTFEPAIATLEQAAPLFPKSARIRTLLGISQYAVWRVEAAIASLTDAIELDPDLTPAYDYLEQVTLESSKAPPERTIDAVRKAKPILCSALELRLARERNDERLRNTAIEKLKQAPAGNAVARCALGQAYQWSGEWAKAREQMEACVKLDSSEQNHYRLGLVYSALNLPDLARREMKLREDAMQQTSDDMARRRDAAQAFQYVVR